MMMMMMMMRANAINWLILNSRVRLLVRVAPLPAFLLFFVSFLPPLFIRLDVQDRGDFPALLADRHDARP